MRERHALVRWMVTPAWIGVRLTGHGKGQSHERSGSCDVGLPDGVDRIGCGGRNSPSAATAPPFYPDKMNLLVWLDQQGQANPVKPGRIGSGGGRTSWRTCNW